MLFENSLKIGKKSEKMKIKKILSADEIKYFYLLLFIRMGRRVNKSGWLIVYHERKMEGKR